MPATQGKAGNAKPTGTTRTTESATAKTEDDVRMIGHLPGPNMGGPIPDGGGYCPSAAGSLATGAGLS